MEESKATDRASKYRRTTQDEALGASPNPPSDSSSVAPPPAAIVSMDDPLFEGQSSSSDWTSEHTQGVELQERTTDVRVDMDEQQHAHTAEEA